MDIVTQNVGTVQCNVLTDSGEIVEDWGVHSDTEETDGRVCSVM